MDGNVRSLSDLGGLAVISQEYEVAVLCDGQCLCLTVVHFTGGERQLS